MKAKQQATPAPDCYICGRSGVSMRYIGGDLWRHEECAPGTPAWCEWYDQHPEKHTSAGDTLRATR